MVKQPVLGLQCTWVETWVWREALGVRVCLFDAPAAGQDVEDEGSSPQSGRQEAGGSTKVLCMGLEFASLTQGSSTSSLPFG